MMMAYLHNILYFTRPLPLPPFVHAHTRDTDQRFINIYETPVTNQAQ